MTMISVNQAEQLIQSFVFPRPSHRVALDQALGEILAEPIRADRDLPPYDRVTMDGIAIDFDRFDPARPFSRQATVRAGEFPPVLQNPEQAIEIMTGAMLPPGCNTVIRYEDLIQGDDMWQIQPGIVIKKGQNIHYQGQDSRKGDVLLPPGTFVTPAALGVCASVGQASVPVFEKPSVLIVSSGEEIVPVDQSPAPFQIRSSNGYALAGILQPWTRAITQLLVPDDPQIIEEQLKNHWNHDIIVLTGGVSAGKYDFIPELLSKLGVEKQLHRVAQKPGKPIWFGTTSDHKAVFALPGNPASSVICTYRFVLPWIQKQVQVHLQKEEAVLEQEFTQKLDLTYFLQVKVKLAQGQWMASAAPGNGSGDLVNLAIVDGFLEIPPGIEVHPAGSVFPFWRMK